MDQSKAPVLDALAAYHESGQTPFTPPGHKQGRGADPRVRAVLGEAVFRSDVLATSGLDDRTSSHGVLEQAQALMAGHGPAAVEEIDHLIEDLSEVLPRGCTILVVVERLAATSPRFSQFHRCHRSLPTLPGPCDGRAHR